MIIVVKKADGTEVVKDFGLIKAEAHKFLREQMGMEPIEERIAFFQTGYLKLDNGLELYLR